MTKGQVSLMSLVAAVPGALLVYGMVLSFLNFADHSPPAFKVIAGIALAMGLLIALLPFGILIFGGPRAPKAEKPKGAESLAAASTAAPGSGDDENVVATQLADDLEVADLEAGGEEDFEMADDTEPVADENFEVDAMETFDGLPLDEAMEGAEDLETFDEFEIEEPDESEPPNKKKKK